MKITFVDDNAEVIAALSREIGHYQPDPPSPRYNDVGPSRQFSLSLQDVENGSAWDVEYYVGDIRSLVTAQSGVAFVRPCVNPDMGIGKSLSEIFPESDSKLHQAIDTYGRTSKLDRKYVGVGSAVMVPLSDNNTWLIESPSGYGVQNVSHTRNAFHAFIAVLALIAKHNCMVNDDGIKHLICCGMGTGSGSMLPIESAKQMKDALDAFATGNTPTETDHIDVPTVFFSHEPLDEQPNIYENTEYKDIAADQVHNV